MSAAQARGDGLRRRRALQAPRRASQGGLVFLRPCPIIPPALGEGGSRGGDSRARVGWGLGAVNFDFTPPGRSLRSRSQPPRKRGGMSGRSCLGRASEPPRQPPSPRHTGTLHEQAASQLRLRPLRSHSGASRRHHHGRWRRIELSHHAARRDFLAAVAVPGVRRFRDVVVELHDAGRERKIAVHRHPGFSVARVSPRLFLRQHQARASRAART